MSIKKLLTLMALFGMFNLTWAEEYEYEDEDEYEYVDEDEEEVVEKKAPKAKAKAKSSGKSRIGLSVGLSGDSKMILGAYDMGNGMEIVVGADGQQYTDGNGDVVTALGAAAGFNYQIGKALLPYGAGGTLTFYNAAMDAEWEDEQMGKQTAISVYFFVKAPLAPNLEASVQSGLLHIRPDGTDPYNTVRTTALLTFYFM